MNNILFIIYPVPSHYFSVFSIAKLFQKKGHSIFFTGDLNCKRIVEDHGFIFININYTSEIVLSNYRVFFGVLINSLVNKKFNRIRYKDFVFSVNQIKEICKKVNPEYVFIDAHLAHYNIFVKANHYKTIIVSTKNATWKISGIPPITSRYIAKDTFLSKIFCEFLWVLQKINLIKKELLKDIALIKLTDEYFVKKFSRNNNIFYYSYINKNNAIFLGTKNTPTILLTPKIFFFKTENLDTNLLFLNLPISRENLLDKNIGNPIIPIEQLRLKKKIVYCSMGTLALNNSKIIVTFFNKVISALSNAANMEVIISTGGIEMVFEKIDNIHIYKFVPQLEILKNTDLMITHGGHTSMKECIQFGVPMLVYPIDIDQNGNSAMIVANKIGLRGELKNEKVNQIKDKVNSILESDLYKNNVCNLKKNLNTQNSENEFFNFINTCYK